MKKFILIGLLGFVLTGCEIRTTHSPPSTTVVHTEPSYIYYDVCIYDDPASNYDLDYEYCSWEDGAYCTCEVYYNHYTGCEEEWCYWDAACGWELSEEWCW